MDKLTSFAELMNLEGQGPFQVDLEGVVLNNVTQIERELDKRKIVDYMEFDFGPHIDESGRCPAVAGVLLRVEYTPDHLDNKAQIKLTLARERGDKVAIVGEYTPSSDGTYLGRIGTDIVIPLNNGKV